MPPKNKLKYVPINFYELKKVKSKATKSINPQKNVHNMDLFFNLLIIGSTGAGKTNILLNLIYLFKNTFNHIYIFTQKHEKLYDFLFEQIKSDLITICYGYSEFKKFDEDVCYGQSLMIFDDFIAEKDQSKIEQHFIKGRKLSNTPN